MAVGVVADELGISEQLLTGIPSREGRKVEFGAAHSLSKIRVKARRCFLLGVKQN